MRKRSVFVPCFLFLFLACAGWLVGRYQQRSAVSRANEILNAADALSVDRSDFAHVVQYVRRYSGEERSSQPTGACTPADCMATVYAFAPPFISRHPNLFSWAGLRPFHVHASLWVRDGTLRATEKVFFVPKAVGATVYVEVSSSDAGRHMIDNPAYKLHHAYLTSFREHHNSPEFRYWLNAGSVTGVAPSSTMDLNCVLSLRGCDSPAQVLPAAWARHRQDQAQQ